MLTLKDAQELVKNPEKARELAAAMIPDKISCALEKKIDSALIEAIACNKVKVGIWLQGGKKEQESDIIVYLHLLGLKNPVSESRQYSCCGSLESDPYVEFSLHDVPETNEGSGSSEK